MVEIPLWLLVIIEEGFIVLAGLVIFFFLRARHFKRRLGRVEASAPAAGEESHGPEALAHKVHVYEKRLKSLERFRTLFFELKDKQERFNQLYAQIEKQVDAVGSDELGAVKETLEKVRQEKARLEEHLQQVSDELDVIMGVSDGAAQRSHLQHTLNAPSQTLGGGLDNVKQMVEKQKREIAELHQQIADLEIEKASADELRAAIDSLIQQNEEMTLAVEVLQDENQYLQQQIEQMVGQQGHVDGSFVMEIDTLRRQLAEKERAYAELERDYADMESKYIELYERAHNKQRVAADKA